MKGEKEITSLTDIDEIFDEIIDSDKPEEYCFHRVSPNGKVLWVERNDHTKGRLEVTFDQKKIYNLWSDYPDNMTKEEVEIFDEEEPFWAGYFSYRKEDPNWREKSEEEPE